LAWVVMPSQPVWLGSLCLPGVLWMLSVIHLGVVIQQYSPLWREMLVSWIIVDRYCAGLCLLGFDETVLLCPRGSTMCICDTCVISICLVGVGVGDFSQGRGTTVMPVASLSIPLVLVWGRLAMYMCCCLVLHESSSVALILCP